MVFRPAQSPHATPLDPNEIDGLIPTYLSTQSQLNALEQANILKAKTWSDEREHREPLREEFVRQLHRRMFEDVWKWAGTYRLREKNIGIDPVKIAVAVRDHLSDTEYWIKNSTYPLDEIGMRFHHRLVQIHPFPNGNGRHARMMTDILIKSLNIVPFTWGAGLTTDARKAYIDALKAADKNRFDLLLAFVRA